MTMVHGSVLPTINRARVALGGQPLTQLPKGMKEKTTGCVIANALKDLAPNIEVGTLSLSGVSSAFADIIAREFGVESIRSDEVVDVPLPEELSAFVRLFDAGMFPELISS